MATFVQEDEREWGEGRLYNTTRWQQGQRSCWADMQILPPPPIGTVCCKKFCGCILFGPLGIWPPGSCTEPQRTCTDAKITEQKAIVHMGAQRCQHTRENGPTLLSIPFTASAASSFLLYWQKVKPRGFLVTLSLGLNTVKEQFFKLF